MKYLFLFYNFPSKMYYYSALYYFITILSSTTSYVLLAANMEDFRILAEQFLPEILTKDILKMDNDTSSNEKPEEYLEFRGKRVNKTPTESKETETRVNPLLQHEKEELKLQSTKRMASKYALILEELVDKVRKRLQAELTLMAATADIETTTESNDIKTSTKKTPELNNSQTKSHLRHLQGRYIKQSRDDIDDKSRQNEREIKSPDKTYVANTYETQKPKLTIDQNIPLAPEVNGGSQPDYDKILSNYNQMDRKVNHHIYPTTNHANSDISNIHDTSQEKLEPTKHTNKEKINHNGPKMTTLEFKKKIFDDFREFETTTKINDYVNYEDETTNYNKKKRKIKKDNKDVNDNINLSKHKQANHNKKPIQPYLEPQKAPENVAENGDPVNEMKESSTTKKPDDIFANHNSISKYIAPYDAKLDEIEIKHRKTDKATVISKDKSSNTSQVKIPIPRDKYRLRKHGKSDLRSNVQSDRNTAVIINGKVVLF